MSDEAVVEAQPTTRGAAQPLDLTVDVEPDRLAILAVRHPSGALTFHRPIETVETLSRGVRGPSRARFQVTVRPVGPTRGVVAAVAKAIVIKVAKLAGDRVTTLLLPRLVAAFESRSWTKHQLKEGWLQVSRDTLAAGRLVGGAPVAPQRSLLFLHGTFSNAAAAFRGLAASKFFDAVSDVYGDRIYAFDHFTLQRTLEENAAMLLDGLPDLTIPFDVITHSRGGLVLRTLVERAHALGERAKRFKVGRVVLVASPNNGTPLATPKRWDQTVGWLANLIELFPDNPFTIGAQFVAHGLVWLAHHAAGDIPGLKAMDSGGVPIQQLQSADDPPVDAYSALVANYNPSKDVLQRLLDAGFDEFFGSANDLVVPSEGGWNIIHAKRAFVPSARIGCFGPGGNLSDETVTHVNFFGHPETADFLVNALLGRTQALAAIDPRRPLPDHRIGRGALPSAVQPAAASAAMAPRTRRPAEPRARVRVVVINGDLRFIRDPLLLGHYASSELTGSEHVMDGLVGGTMRHALELGDYPLAPGTHRVFLNRYVDPQRGMIVPRPEAVIVAGLGVEGGLRQTELTSTVRAAVVGWARRRAEEPKVPRSFTLAATLIGSGGSGISAGQSAHAILDGVLQANAVLSAGNTGAGRKRATARDEWPFCSELHLIELYLDRAVEAWRALQVLGTLRGDQFALLAAVQRERDGERRPPHSSYRGAPYDFVGVEIKPAPEGTQTFEYTLDTQRARSEVRAQKAQTTLLWELVSTASNERSRDDQIGVTLANLIVPIELDSYLASAPGLQIALDPDAAAIPWELLEVDRSRARDDGGVPWSIRVKLLRKLKLEQFRERVTDANREDDVLVIGEPETTDQYPRLEGARREAVRVHETLVASGRIDAAKVTLLAAATPAAARPDAYTIVNTLFQSKWRIVHISGHGAPASRDRPAGVVLSKDQFLTAAEIKNLRTVPELVFINCCYLGQVTDDAGRSPRYDRARFASGVAGGLIDIGVRCVVAAGWAVDDDAAAEFASTFYEAILAGERFIDAVTRARRATWEHHSDVNTWAAYQCYGDADWRYRSQAADPNQAEAPTDFSFIVSDEQLILELERIYTETKFRNGLPAAQIAALQALDTHFKSVWGKQGRIAEAFAKAYSEAGALDRAIAWYRDAVAAADSSASAKAAEQLGNALSRAAWDRVDAAARHRDAMREQIARLGVGRRREVANARRGARAALRDAERQLAKAEITSRRQVAESLTLLRRLAADNPTMERNSLVGSAVKRRLMVRMAAGGRAPSAGEVQEMRSAYAQAIQSGEREHAHDLHYPASNCVAADAILAIARRGHRLDPAPVKIVEEALKGDADFWTEASRIELQQYHAIAARALAREAAALERQYRHLHERATSTHMWASIYDSAWLVLTLYARRSSPRERAASEALLSLVRGFAHPLVETSG